MKSLMKLIGAAALLSLTYSATAAADLKVGVVDLQQILQKAPQIASLNKQLSDQFKPRQEKIIAAKKNLDDEAAKFERDSSVMNPSDRAKMQNKIIEDKANLQAMAASFQTDVSTSQGQAMQKFSGQLADALSAVAKAEKLDLILQKQGVPYADEKLNVTSKVLDALKK